jgi:tight adherence protein B
MATQLVSVLAALMIFGALALLAIGYQRSRARAATPDMETRLDRYGGSTEPESTESGGRATSAVTERIDRAVKGKSFAEKVQIAISRADLRMTVGEFLAMRMARR